jgi:uncharacterized membrane protein
MGDGIYWGVVIMAAGLVASLLGFEFGLLGVAVGYLVAGGYLASISRFTMNWRRKPRFAPLYDAAIQVIATSAVILAWPVVFFLSAEK